MPALQTIPLPFPLNKPPPGFDYQQRPTSPMVFPDEEAALTAVREGVVERDSWNGERKCVVCGSGKENGLRFCEIIPKSEPYTWVGLAKKNYIPHPAKSVSYEPRNFMLMCPEHRKAFNKYSFFIRFVPQERKYIFINFSRSPNNAQYHAKAINLKIDDRHAPFPAILLIHEMRVRGIWAFLSEPDDIPTTIPFQDWMTTDNRAASETGNSAS